MMERGIVRRIDELGRLVIPKELRKTLRIKEGDPLEIYASKDDIVLKKYSPLTTINTYAQAIADSINSITEKSCLITDADALIYATGGKNKEFIGKALSEQMDKILKDRKSVVLSKSDGGTIVSIVKGEDFEAENQIIVPLICGGDCFGSIVLFDKEKSSRFNSGDVKLVQLASTFLSFQLE